MKIKRNDQCPCGSGKKYKKCCALNEQSPNSGLTAAVRMKGGVCFDPTANAYRAVVHSWDNAACTGEPKEWKSTEIFPTEDAAMDFYKASIRPSLAKLMEDASRKVKDSVSMHHRIEE